MPSQTGFVKEYATYPYPEQCGVTCAVNHTVGQYPLHRHDYLEFEYLSEGRIEHELNGVKTVLSAGDFWCLGRRDLHRFTVLEPVAIHNIAVFYKSAPPVIQQLAGSIHLPLTGSFPKGHLPEVDRLFFCLSDAVREQTPYSEARIGAYLALLLTEMFEAGTPLTDKPAPSGYHHIANAIEFMAQNYASDLTLRDVASHVYLSETYFSKLFAEISGSTFLAYLTKLRIDQAKELLSATETPITRIALDCGFGSFSTFSRIFKNQCGCSPTDYRRQTRA